MHHISTLNAHKNQIKANLTALAVKVSVISGFLAAQRFYFAGNLTIIDNIGTTASNLLSQITNTYCHSLVWLLFAIELLIFLLSKDEKKIALAKKCAVGCFIFYIVLKMMGVDGGILGSSADTIAGWMSGQ